jgi:hypothetical protein
MTTPPTLTATDRDFNHVMRSFSTRTDRRYTTAVEDWSACPFQEHRPSTPKGGGWSGRGDADEQHQ